MLIRNTAKLGCIAVWLFSLPVMGVAQQIAVNGGYPLLAPYSSPYAITAGTDGALWFTEGVEIVRMTTASFNTISAVPLTEAPRLHLRSRPVLRSNPIGSKQSGLLVEPKLTRRSLSSDAMFFA